MFWKFSPFVDGSSQPAVTLYINIFVSQIKYYFFLKVRKLEGIVNYIVKNQKEYS